MLVGWCAAAADTGRIYVYAQWETAARSYLPISCDGVEAAAVRQGTFFAIDLPPGRHALGVAGGVPAFTDLHADESLFVRLDWHYETGRSPVPQLKLVAAEQARREMINLGYIPAKRVRASTVHRTDPRDATPALKRR